LPALESTARHALTQVWTEQFGKQGQDVEAHGGQVADGRNKEADSKGYGDMTAPRRTQ